MKDNKPASRDFRSTGGRDGPKRVRARVIDPAEVVYRGHYDLAEFIARYGLAPMEAREILLRYGPARANLDQYMRERGMHLGA